jgi:hypothetical protein
VICKVDDVERERSVESTFSRCRRPAEPKFKQRSAR